MMKRVISSGLVALAVVGVVSGCAMPDPCAALAPPTAAELAAVQAGSEVEREVSNGNVDCELSEGRWVQETN